MTTFEAMVETQKNTPDKVSLSIPMVLLGLGILLIAGSYLPIGQFVAQSQWSREDSAAYDKVSQRYKRSNYQLAARAGVSEEEWQSQRKNMKLQMDAKNERLAKAKSQPRMWSQGMLWIGALLAAGGAVYHQMKSA